MSCLKESRESMWEDRYRDFLEKSIFFTKKEKQFFIILLGKKEMISPRYMEFMHDHLKYTWGQVDTQTNEEKSDKEHAISYLISRSLYGTAEKKFYQQIVRIPTKNIKMKEKVKKKRIQNRKTDKTNRGMILWLAEALEVPFDLEKTEEDQFKSLIDELNEQLAKVETP